MVGAIQQVSTMRSYTQEIPAIRPQLCEIGASRGGGTTRREGQRPFAA